MESLKILFVEDAESDIESFDATVRRYELEKKRTINSVIAKDKETALSALDSSFHGAIIDINLGTAGNRTEGNDVIKAIRQQKRIPVIVHTGTPASASDEVELLGCFKKGEVGYSEIFDIFYDVYNTGLIKILGGRGIIEEATQKIFWKHLIPQMSKWKEYSTEDVEKTERSILRLVLNHLHDLLDSDESPSHPEEMYIIPPLSDKIKTGSIIKKTGGENQFNIVISPPCDLVIRENGTCKTDKILISEIELFDTVKDKALAGITNAEKRKNKMLELLKNNYTDYYHWLPQALKFDGGFINFRWVKSIETTVLATQYGKSVAQLSAPFVKEVISRFSAFYARQGQPDLDFAKLATAYLVPKAD